MSEHKYIMKLNKGQLDILKQCIQKYREVINGLEDTFKNWDNVGCGEAEYYEVYNLTEKIRVDFVSECASNPDTTLYFFYYVDGGVRYYYITCKEAVLDLIMNNPAAREKMGVDPNENYASPDAVLTSLINWGDVDKIDGYTHASRVRNAIASNVFHLSTTV